MAGGLEGGDGHGGCTAGGVCGTEGGLAGVGGEGLGRAMLVEASDPGLGVLGWG